MKRKGKRSVGFLEKEGKLERRITSATNKNDVDTYVDCGSVGGSGCACACACQVQLKLSQVQGAKRFTSLARYVGFRAAGTVLVCTVLMVEAYCTG